MVPDPTRQPRQPRRQAHENGKAGLHYLAFLVPATGVISNLFLEDLEMMWSLRDVIPDPTKYFT